MPSRVLIVDDVEMNRDMLKVVLEDHYEIEEAENGRQAVDILIDHGAKIDAMLLDLRMPVMNGFEVIAYMRQNTWITKIPVLVVTSEHSSEIESKCFEMGVSDFLHKPFEPELIVNRIKNLVELFGYKRNLEEKVEKQTAMLRNQYQLLRIQAEKLRENNDKIVEILGTVVEQRNLESGLHIKRVKGFTRILAKQIMQSYPEYELDDKKIHMIVGGSALHDLGKITIPDRILLKPGMLTDDEFEYMKSHTTRGCEMLKGIEGIWDDEYQKICYDICRHHHERYDGKGYPDGLKGDDIPIAAQIVSVTDVYEALISERVYKHAYTKEEAFYMIINGECGVFSPKVMECLRLVKIQFEKLADEQ